MRFWDAPWYDGQGVSRKHRIWINSQHQESLTICMFTLTGYRICNTSDIFLFIDNKISADAVITCWRIRYILCIFNGHLKSLIYPKNHLMFQEHCVRLVKQYLAYLGARFNEMDAGSKTLRPEWHGHFANDNFKYIFVSYVFRISIDISLKYIPKDPIDKSLPEPAMAAIVDDIYASQGHNELITSDWCKK